MLTPTVLIGDMNKKNGKKAKRKAKKKPSPKTPIPSRPDANVAPAKDAKSDAISIAKESTDETGSKEGQKMEKIRWTDKLIAFTTVVIAFATVVQGY